MRKFNSICVYCGSSDKMGEEYIQAARQTGALLAERHITLVYGAGKTGLMGAVADGAVQGGGQVVGVIPKVFYTPVLVHTGLTRLEVVEDIHARKARMAQLADGFIALPGGYGTFEEFFEILTWAQIGLHTKPIGLLNVEGYFDPLFGLLQHASAQGFIYPDHLHLFSHARSTEEVLTLMETYTPPSHLARWMEREAYTEA